MIDIMSRSFHSRLCFYTFHIRPFRRFLSVGFLFNLMQIFLCFLRCRKGAYCSIAFMEILITNIVPNSKIFPRCKGIACFRDGKSLVSFNLIFFCDLLCKGKHSFRFFCSFAAFQLPTGFGGIHIREIVAALKA